MASSNLSRVPRGMHEVSRSVSAAQKGIAAQRYKKLLLVCKESRLDRFNKKGLLARQGLEQKYL